MNIHDATEQAYKNGYEAGLKAASEKQIPKKPKLKEKDWGHIRYFEVCPNCEDMIFPENLFCAKCGQALKWENN